MSQSKETAEQHPCTTDNVQHDKHRPASPWMAGAGALVLGILFTVLLASEQVSLSWLPIVVIAVLVLILPVRTFVIRRPPSHEARRGLSFILLGVVTIVLVIGVVLLINALTSTDVKTTGRLLLRIGALLWTSNILVFSLWYWEIDGGGALRRHQQGHQAADFMFPQQTDGNQSHWVPHYLDYLFVAFIGATSLSPADTYPLTHKAKILMMLEVIIALLVVSVLIGRAVNIL